jgi:predicted 3-demethylubiquinone-9 3-methyltransferase (glyoxalase superfamily)
MSKITPFLWFDHQAEEAMLFYTSIFKNSYVVSVSRGGPDGPDGPVLIANFVLDGQPVTALNGGPYFHFTEAFSFYVDCDDQAEVDELWEKLGAGGEISQCGWLKDKFGLSWQIVPKALGQLMGDPDPEKAQRVMQAMLKMTKLDVAALQRAHDGS